MNDDCGQREFLTMLFLNKINLVSYCYCIMSHNKKIYKRVNSMIPLLLSSKNKTQIIIEMYNLVKNYTHTEQIVKILNRQ